MKKLLLTLASLIAFSAQAMVQDAPLTQRALKPGVNLMGEKQSDQRMEEYGINRRRLLAQPHCSGGHHEG
jgi:hypothetical protein